MFSPFLSSVFCPFILCVYIYVYPRVGSWSHLSLYIFLSLASFASRSLSFSLVVSFSRSLSIALNLSVSVSLTLPVCLLEGRRQSLYAAGQSVFKFPGALGDGSSGRFKFLEFLREVTPGRQDRLTPGPQHTPAYPGPRVGRGVGLPIPSRRGVDWVVITSPRGSAMQQGMRRAAPLLPTCTGDPSEIYLNVNAKWTGSGVGPGEFLEIS